MGHLETDDNMLYTMLPSTLIPDHNETTSIYQRHKDDLCSSCIDFDTYKKLNSKIMMGKKGLIRAINSIKIEGSMKMVISVGDSGSEGAVDIQSSIANKIVCC
jgi:hypothetical protein